MHEDCPMDMFDETAMDELDFAFFEDIEDIEDDYNDCTIHDWNFWRNCLVCNDLRYHGRPAQL